MGGQPWPLQQLPVGLRRGMRRRQLRVQWPTWASTQPSLGQATAEHFSHPILLEPVTRQPHSELCRRVLQAVLRLKTCQCQRQSTTCGACSEASAMRPLNIYMLPDSSEQSAPIEAGAAQALPQCAFAEMSESRREHYCTGAQATYQMRVGSTCQVKRALKSLELLTRETFRPCDVLVHKDLVRCKQHMLIELMLHCPTQHRICGIPSFVNFTLCIAVRAG